MSDRDTRAQERQEAVDGEAPFAVRLRRRLREGTVPADKLNLYAYCGDEQARQARHCFGCHGSGYWDVQGHTCPVCHPEPADWASGLVPLLNLEDWHGPDLWACRTCLGEGVSLTDTLGPCSACEDDTCWEGTGKRPPTREEAHRWRCVAVAAAVVREALASHNRALLETIFGPDGSRAALDAVDAWLACPCEEHARVCRDAFYATTGLPLFVNYVLGVLTGEVAEGDLPAALTSAADLGVDVRTVTLRTAEGWL